MIDLITIVAKSMIKTGKKEEYLDLVEELILKSREEKGCISYSLYEDLKNPNVLTFIEEWEDEDSISSHNATMHYTTIVPKLRELREGNWEVSLYRMIR
jgi:quinol monooxygenase YgiN